MCHQNSCGCLSVEEASTGEENLLIHCKPIELYNILLHRARDNPSFLRRCLGYKRRAKRKRGLRAGIVVFNYRDYSNMLQKTEVTEDFSCPFCLMQCASFEGLRYHLCSSHDLLNFDFWVTEDYLAVNISVKTDALKSEVVAGGVEPQLQTFSFCSKPRRRRPKNFQNEKHPNIQFLELDSPKLSTDDAQTEISEKDIGESVSKSISEEKKLNGRGGAKSPGFDAAECIKRVSSSFNVPGVSMAMAQSSVDPECVKSLSGNEAAVPAILHVAKSRKLTADWSDTRNYVLLHKRQFYHSHRVQPMAVEKVMSDQDSEDEIDNDIADFEDRRMLDDFVDVCKHEKLLMHLWNSFVRKQSLKGNVSLCGRVLADGHVPWACEAFSELHGQELVLSPALFWCWRLFMIKLWNHGLLDGSTMNNCNLILERCQDEGSDVAKS